MPLHRVAAVDQVLADAALTEALAAVPVDVRDQLEAAITENGGAFELLDRPDGEDVVVMAGRRWIATLHRSKVVPGWPGLDA